MKILIADDEKLARYTLKSMLKEIGIPSSSIQVACDGLEMVEKVAVVRPDLALVDIKMPRLNGLEAIQKSRSLSPHTKWIILTSYSMFEYAKRAVSLGASAYLLKPVSPQELSQAVRQICQMNRGTYQRLNDEFEAHLNALLHNTTSFEHETLDFLANAVFWGSLLVFDSNLNKNELLLQEHRVCELIRKKQAAVLDQTTRFVLCRMADEQLALIGAWVPGHGDRESYEAIRDLLRKLQISLNLSMPQGVCCSIIVGERFDNYKEFSEHLHVLAELAPLRAIIGVNRSIPWNSIRDRRLISPYIELSRNLVALSASVREGTYLDFFKLVETITGIWQGMMEQRRVEIHYQIMQYLRVALGFELGNSRRTDPWLETLRQHGKYLFESPKEGKPRDIIEQLVDFIDNNYMDEISVGQIAGDLNLTPNYLSQLFHKKTGTTFMKYLTRLRLIKARELLANPARRVREVAQEVGYASARHFSALFKTHEGITPTEYRIAHRSGSRKQ